jgi:hypothetical protein
VATLETAAGLGADVLGKPKRPMPKVSIILPTCNRADTIMRAIRSVQAQSFQDWELIVVDDGSTDNTMAALAGIDARITLIRQENRGFTEARNTGIRAGSCDFFAFLDSDDEFMPHHLELCVAFLETFKEEQFVSTELLEDFGHGRVVNHYRTETSDWYPKKAGLIGSHGLDLPSGKTDDYLRVYESREPIVDWGSRTVERVNPGLGAFLYRGMIFEHMRYDFLITITATVMRSSVFAILGLPEPHWSTGSDFHFLARLCRTWRANYISVPTHIKHEYAADGALPIGPRRDGQFRVALRHGLAEGMGRFVLDQEEFGSGVARPPKPEAIWDGPSCVEFRRSRIDVAVSPAGERRASSILECHGSLLARPVSPEGELVQEICWALGRVRDQLRTT